MKTVKLSCSHALFKYLIAQKTIIDGKKVPLFPGAFGIYGHGNVACIGQAMEEFQSDLPGYRGHHEQNMALTGIGYARAMRRKQIFIATSSVGPGSTNMVTAAAVALSNRLPLLLIPGDTFSSRFPDPVLQQVENFNAPTETQNDSFKSVSRYFDRITRPEQILSSLPQAIQVMLDPADCGPATISMSQDVQGEVYDYPEVFFEEKVHEIRKVYPDPNQIQVAAEQIKQSKQPIIISGGGVLYSEAEKELSDFAKKHNLRVIEDAAHAFGSEYKGQRIGFLGDIVCFSFDGIKNITSGEGGCVVSSDENIISAIKNSRLLGVHNDTENRFEGLRTWNPDVTSQGWRYHMSDLMAAIGRVQLKNFEYLKNKRQQLAKIYISLLNNNPFIKTNTHDYTKIVPHIFVIEVSDEIDRDKLIAYLLKHGIPTGLHYKPNHLLSFFKTDFTLKNTEKIYSKIITLPLHPDLEDSDIHFISKKIKDGVLKCKDL